MPTSQGLIETGETAIVAGAYVSDCCGHQIVMQEGKLFPPCRTCRDHTLWKRAGEAARTASQ